MPTATDALQAAADELHAATVAMYAVRDEVRVKLTQTSAAATTVITNFLRSNAKNYFLDQIVGSDTNDGLDPARPMKTLDAILDAIEADGTTVFGAVVFLLSDGVIRRFHNMSSPFSIVGAEWGAGPLGAAYRTVVRSLSYQGEALNSPIASVGRTVPSVRATGSTIRLASLAIQMPDVPSFLDSRALYQMVNGGNFICDGVTLTCATAGSAVSLLGVGAPTNVSFYGTLGTNAPGKLLLNIGAGANPNSDFAYRSNLTAA